MPKRRKSMTDKETRVEVPHPHHRPQLNEIEDKIREIALEMQRLDGANPYTLCQSYVYLIGYRDGMLGRQLKT